MMDSSVAMKCLRRSRFSWGTVLVTAGFRSPASEHSDLVSAVLIGGGMIRREQASSQVDDIFSAIDVDGSGECSMEVIFSCLIEALIHRNARGEAESGEEEENNGTVRQEICMWYFTRAAKLRQIQRKTRGGPLIYVMLGPI